MRKFSEIQEESVGTETVRSYFEDSSDIFDDQNIFIYYMTLDPSEVSTAWEKLNVNTWELEFRNLPSLLHSSLINAIGRSAKFGQGSQRARR